MTLQQNLARLVTGAISLRDLPRVAVEAMQQGLESPSLHILAGLSYNENDFVIEQYFKAALHELSVELPAKRQAAIEVALEIADEILEGKRSFIEGVQDLIWNGIQKSYPFYEENIHYAYDSIGFANVYGLFYTIDDLKCAGSLQWQKDKTNQQLEEELTQELLQELKNWVQLMRSGH